MWLLLCEDISKKFNFNKNYTYLLDLNKINILVGKNNSGKSYLMREILKNSIDILNRTMLKKLILKDENFTDLSKINKFDKVDVLKDINMKYINIIIQLQKFFFSKIKSSTTKISGNHSGTIYNFENFTELKENSKELLEYIGLDLNSTEEECSDKIVYEYDSIEAKIKREYKAAIEGIFDEIKDEYMYQFGSLLNELGYVKQYINRYNKHFELYGAENTFKNYIPLLRNIRHPLKSTKDKNSYNTENIFKKRILDEYEYDEKEINVITGLDFYSEYKEKLLGTKKERALVNEFEQFLSNYFFEGKEVSIIPDEKTYELKINIKDDEDKFIYQVGDGITSLIIMIYDAFMKLDNKTNIYFIEEPEQSFHPGFQRLFMNIISINEKFKNCYFFFTTHSNHLIDISNHEFNSFTNYLCSKDDENKINVKVQNKLDIEVIKELGVNPSSVQIANKIIWVEGKYDALYLRLLLKMKNKKLEKRQYIEDYDYVFVPYGGTNGTLIMFSIDNEIEENEEFILKARKINENFLLIMDDDGIATNESGNAKTDRYNKLKGELKEQIYKLEVREIENLFPEEVIKMFFKQGIKKDSNYDLKFLENIKYDDYKNKKLGGFFNKLVEDNLGKDLKEITGREEGFEKKGFLYDKSKFYDCVLEWIMKEEFDYERDIPSETKNLINTVEEFIKK